MNAALLAGFASGEDDKLYVEDVFSAYTYTGTGSALSIANGIDLSTKGGLVWAKCRGNADFNVLSDTTQGVNKYLISDQNYAQQSETALTAFNTDGFTLGAWASANTNLRTYISWTYRNAPKFFTHTSVTKSAGSDATVDLATLGTVGMVTVKNVSTGDWYTWHRSLTAGKLVYLNKTNAEATLGHITVSGTTLTLVNGVIADGTYIVYAWAHDASADGIIQCGSFTTDDNGNATVDLGWEPQYCIAKRVDSLTAGKWFINDSARGMPVSTTGSESMYLVAEGSSPEYNGVGASPTATGFIHRGTAINGQFIYLAIRRGPMRVPTDATKVYNAIARTGTGAAATVTGVGFAPDCVMHADRQKTVWAQSFSVYDRLRGVSKYLNTQTTAAEGDLTPFVTSIDMDGVTLTNSGFNSNITTYISHFFRRAPGFMDQVCGQATSFRYTGAHNLAVTPELIIVFDRTSAYDHVVYHKDLGVAQQLFLNSTSAAAAADAASWSVSSTSFSTPKVTAFGLDNVVAYLFANLPGISKVGSYTGNGSSQTIDCGFSTGARFVLIKRTDSTGDWFVWDSVRGIVAGSDPHLSLNTTAAEVTTDDSVDPYAAGITVNQVAATNINVTSASYIFLAIA